MSQHSRREFLRTTSAAAALGMIGVFPREALARAARDEAERTRPMAGDPFIRELAMHALDVAKGAGASYTDVRINVGKERRSDMRDRALLVVRATNESLIGIRVLVNGAWGFATTTELTRDEVARTSLLAVKQAKSNPNARAGRIELAPAPVVPNGSWETPIESDPFKRDVSEQIAVQLAAVEAGFTAKAKGALIRTRFSFSVSEQSFANSEGSWIVQTIRSFGGWYAVQAFSADGVYGALLSPEGFRTGGYGWEAIGPHLLKEAPETTERAVSMMVAPKVVSPGRYDVVLDGHAVAAVLQASVTRALQLDRVYGYEMNDSGTSYLSPPEQTLGKYTFGTPLLTVRGTRSLPHASGTVKWDDEGVAPDDFTLIQNGTVVDYMTSREFASKIAWWYAQRSMPVRSHGCAAAAAPGQSQLVVDPTIIMEPGTKETSIEEMIADVKKGLYFTSNTFVQMDPALLNMETRTFAPVYEIRNGKLGGLVQQAGMIARTPDFWKSMDVVGGKKTQVSQGYAVFKGSPAFQVSREAVCPAARFRQVNIAGFTRKA